MKYCKKVEGEKVYLSPLCLEDAETYVEWLNQTDISYNIHGTHKVATIDSERAWITKVLESQDYQFAIVLKENDTLLGNCGFNDLNLMDGVASVGIFLGEEGMRHQGYGSEALNLLLQYGFQVLHLHSIDLTVYDFNQTAIKCYTKLGFQVCGQRHECYYLNGKYHDRIMMEILEKDWREKNESAKNGRIS